MKCSAACPSRRRQSEPLSPNLSLNEGRRLPVAGPAGATLLISSLLISAVLLSDEAEAASLRITSTVEPLYVHVDGQLRGQTPVVVDLGAGTHKIEVRQSVDDMMSVVEFVDVGSEPSGTLSFDWNDGYGKLTWVDEERRRAAEAAVQKRLEEGEVAKITTEDAAKKRAEVEADRRRQAEDIARKRLEDAEVARILAEEDARKRQEDAEVARILAEDAAKKRAEVEADRRRQAEGIARKRLEDAEVARILAEEDARKRLEDAEVARILAEEVAREKAEAKRLAAEEAVRQKAAAAEAKRLAAEEAGRAKAEAGARAREEETRKREARDAAKREADEAVSAERAAQEEERRLAKAAREQELRDEARGRIRVEFTVGPFDTRLTIRVTPQADAPMVVQSGGTVSLPLGPAEAVASFAGKSVRWKLQAEENAAVDAALSDIVSGRAPAGGPVTVQTDATFPLPTAALLSIGEAEPIAFLAEPGAPLLVEAELQVPLRPAVTAPLAASVRAGPGTIVSWTVDPGLHPALPLREELGKAQGKRRAHSIVSLGGLGVGAGALLVSAIEFGLSQAAYDRILADSSSREDYNQLVATWTGARSVGIGSIIASGVAIGFAGVWEFGLGGKGRAQVRDARAEFEDALRSPVSPQDMGETEGGGPNVQYRSYGGASPVEKSSYDEEKPRPKPTREERPVREEEPDSEDEPDRKDEPDFEEEDSEEEEKPQPEETDTEEVPDFGEEGEEDEPRNVKKRAGGQKKSGSGKRSDDQADPEEGLPEEGLPEEELPEEELPEAEE